MIMVASFSNDEAMGWFWGGPEIYTVESPESIAKVTAANGVYQYFVY